ncbi:MAG: CIA30 family protein, partial [Akkermansiaceae bacterium]
MKSSLNIPIAALCMSFGHISLLHAGNSVAEFDQKEAKSLDWRVVNDGVMGGLSKGQLNVSKDGILNFKGNLSLENNGGFSSIRTEKVSMDFSDADGFKARVKGDGRTYQLRFNTDARFRGMEVSFMAEFPTKKDSWTEVEIPFSDFTGSFRGMKLRKETFDPSKISRVGLLLADKKSGPFELNVDWIRTYGAGDSNSGGSDIVSLALADGRFGTLATALTKAGLVETLQGDGPFTVFAPTDKAFSALPKGTVESLLKPENKEKLQSILKYHVIGGSIDLASALKAGKAKTLLGESASIAFKSGQVKVNDAALIDADIEASNGVIHVIDSVILPPKPSNDIASVAKRAGNFETLLAAIDAAGLSKALAGEGPLTILAPTDEAFKKLPKGTVQSLLKSE